LVGVSLFINQYNTSFADKFCLQMSGEPPAMVSGYHSGGFIVSVRIVAHASIAKYNSYVKTIAVFHFLFVGWCFTFYQPIKYFSYL